MIRRILLAICHAILNVPDPAAYQAGVQAGIRNPDPRELVAIGVAGTARALDLPDDHPYLEALGTLMRGDTIYIAIPKPDDTIGMYRMHHPADPDLLDLAYDDDADCRAIVAINGAQVMHDAVAMLNHEENG